MTTKDNTLDRFVLAQEDTYADALAELRAGLKQSHWMWFVLPQLRGLGRSATAQRFGLADGNEARAYLQHPVLGARPVTCVEALLAHRGKPAAAILGEVDAMKLRSCLTLFQAVAPHQPVFAEALAAFFGGRPDPHTLQLLQRG